MRPSLWARHVVPALAAAAFLLPLVYMVAGSLRPVGEPPPEGVELLPSNPTLASYPRLLQLLPLLTYLRNSVVVAAIAVPLTVLVASWAGFGMRLLPPRRRRQAVVASLVVLLVPVTAVWATRFEVFRVVGAIDTLVPLVAPALMATSPFFALIYLWSFSGIPDSQLEAARLEGASPWRVWRVLAMPQAKPATLAVTVLAFTYHWANFIDPLLYLNDQNRFTLPLGLQTLVLLNPTDWPLLMAGAVVVTMPTVIVFLFAQRLFLDDPAAAVQPRRRRRAARAASGMLVLALLAGACGGPQAGTEGPAEPGGGAAQDGADLTVVLFGDPIETAGYRTMIEEFQAANPGITVTLSPVARQDELLAKLTTAFAGGQPPDVFLVNYRRYGQFAEQGAIEPVQPYLDASTVLSEEDFAPTALEAFRYDGENLTCMPQNVSSLVVYYNVELFQQAGLPVPREGWTWDDFLAAAKALTDGRTYGVGVEPSIIRVAPFVWSAGGELVDNHADPTTLTIADGPAREGLDFFLDLSLVHGVVPPDREEQSMDSESRFTAGRLGMFLDSRKAVPGFREAADFTWDVAPLPRAPGGEQVSILHGDAYCMSAGTPNLDEAWRLIEFAMSERGQTILAQSGRTVPSRIDVASAPVFLQSDQPPASSQVFLDQVPNLRATPHTAAWSRVEKETGSMLEDIFYGRTDRVAGILSMVDETRALFALQPGS